MLNKKILAENMDEVINKLNTRQKDFSYLKDLLPDFQQRKELIIEVENLKQERNELSKNISKLVQAQEESKVNENKKKVNEIKEKIDLLDIQLVEIEERINKTIEVLPNVPDKSVPIGKDETENVEIRKWGTLRSSYNVKEHWEIALKLDMVDFERAVKLSGSRFVIYKNWGARLERALMNFMLDEHNKNGFMEVSPPILVQPKIMYGTGNLPKFADDLYYIEKDNLYLIPTAEVPLTSLYAEEILLEQQLPMYFCAFTPCFRQEAGSAGKDTKGIIRLHQFKKVEMVKYTLPSESFNELEKMVNNAENILQLLKIPYRVVTLCTGDMGFSSAKTYDLELWMPGQNKYREVSSCSNCLDFQARRMNLRYRDKNQKIDYIHTLNGSGLAIDRVIAAIIENYQTDSGTILVPQVLQKYLNNIVEIK